MGQVQGRTTAVSSRGLGHSPLKAGTRVRIPLPLLGMAGQQVLVPVLAQYVGPIVYRLGRDPFKVERRVRLPLGLCGSIASGREESRRAGKGVGGVAQFG